MNAFKRAWRYITRRPTKSLLLIITFFLIGNLVILGLGISQAADNAKVLTRKQMRAAVSYEVDYDKYYEYVNTLEDEDEINKAYQNYPRVSEEAAIAISQDERVKAFNYMMTTTAMSDGFENVPIGNEEERGTSSYVDEAGNEVVYREPNLMIYANLFPEMIEFEEGTFTVTDGKMYDQNDLDQERNVVLITDELAETNGLRVGDAIRISTLNTYMEQEFKAHNLDTEVFFLELEIIGIFHNLNMVDPNAENFRWMSAYESPQNILLMPMTAYRNYYRDTLRAQIEVQQIAYSDSSINVEEAIENNLAPSRVVYLLIDPLEVDQFVEDHQKDIGEYLKLNANNETFKRLARPLDTMSFFANIVVWIVIVNAIVIITLVTALTLKTREYEIGVLLSMGVSKVKVILQLFTELFILALLGFTLAVGSGSLMAGTVGRAVLDYQTASDSQYGEVEDGGYYWHDSTDYFTEVSQDEMLSQYEVSVSPLLIFEIYVLGTAVVLIAIVIPSFMIMRLNPKQILLEQN